MSRAKNKLTISVFVVCYAVIQVFACAWLIIDRHGPVDLVLKHELFSLPWFEKPLEVTGWKLIGSIGAMMFAMRWVVQAYYSRRAGKPVTPLTFWVMSLLGSNLQLMYFIWSPKQDMVGVIANFLPTFVAAYNLYLEISHRSKSERDAAQAKARAAAPIITVSTQEPAAGE